MPYALIIVVVLIYLLIRYFPVIASALKQSVAGKGLWKSTKELRLRLPVDKV